MTNTHKDILVPLGIKQTNSGASYGEWVKKPTGGELVSHGAAHSRVFEDVGD